MALAGTPATKDELKKSMDEAEWSWLKPHAARDGLILVSQSLELLDVGMAVAANDSRRIKTWIEEGRLLKPVAEQLQEWDRTPERRFMSLVVQPYVLIQEPLLH
jgi:hypothetical protein